MVLQSENESKIMAKPPKFIASTAMAQDGNVKVDAEQVLQEEEKSHPQVENQILPKKVPDFCSLRYGLSLLLNFCNGAIVMQRVCLSLTMVVMVNGTMGQTNVSTKENSVNRTSPVYNWSPEIQGIILSSVFYGTIIVQIPVGCLSGMYSVKKMVACGLILSSVCTLCIPAAAEVGETLLIMCRVLQGMAQGIVSLCQHSLWVQWAPPLERARLTSISVSGAMLGPFTVLLVTGFICDFLGWPLVFYIFGAYGCVLSLFWFILVYDDPKDHPFISIKEKEYITSSLAQQDSQSTVKTLSIKSMLKSLPLWAICLSHFAIFWSNSFSVAYTPTFVNSVLDVDIKENGFLSSLPFLFAYIFGILGGYSADFLLTRNILSILSIRKLLTALGMLLPVIFNMCMLYLGFSFYSVVVFLILSQATSAFALSGTIINTLDIAPRYYGFLKGVTILIGMIGGVISSTITGLILSVKSETSWHKIYFLMSAISVSTLIFYLIFAKAEIQDWAKENQDTRL